MTSPDRSRKRILLFAEAVTLAHLARPLCFVRELDPKRYQTALACARHGASHAEAAGIERLDLDSIEPRRFLSALSRGRMPYDFETLQRYAEADLAAIERFAPDLIVGDFRLSLSVSARLARIPYVSIASAYWSPYYTPPCWPVPSLPLTRFLPIGIAQALFKLARPLAFAWQCGPLNRLRVRNGLPPLPRDLRFAYTDADHVAYSDLQELFPVDGLPATHRFLGPVLWEPSCPRPAWWDDVPADRPCVYLTLGSSGSGTLLPRLVDALASSPAALLVSSVGAALPERLPRHVFHAQYLPGLQAAQRSDLVICNGGSLTAYQALFGGAQVLGIASNLDQFLNMQGFERVNAGRTLRADRFSAARVRAEVDAVLPARHDAGSGARLHAPAADRRFETGAAGLVAELIG